MSASNHPMGAGPASGAIPHAFASSSFPPPPGPPPPPFRPAAPPPPNSCDRLIVVARALNARPVYHPARRVGGEDHRPLFHSELLLAPQGYYSDGTGHSKLAARRAAAGNMLQYLQQRALIPTQGPTPNPVPDRNIPCDDEIEDGELPTPDSLLAPVSATNGHPHPSPPLFFFDRDPDPELEVVAESLSKEPADPKEQPVKEEQHSPKEEPHPAHLPAKPLQTSVSEVPPSPSLAPTLPAAPLERPSLSLAPPVLVIPRSSPIVKPVVSPTLRSSPVPVSPPIPHSAEPVRPAVSPTIRGPQLNSELPLPRIKRLPLVKSQPAQFGSAIMSLNRMIHATSPTPSPPVPVPRAANSQPLNRVMLRSAAPPPSDVKLSDPRVQAKPEQNQVTVEAMPQSTKPVSLPKSPLSQPVGQVTPQPAPPSQPTSQPSREISPKPPPPLTKPQSSNSALQVKPQPAKPAPHVKPGPGRPPLTKPQSSNPALQVKPQPAKPAPHVKPGPGRPAKEPTAAAKVVEQKKQVKLVLRSSGPPRKWREGLADVDEVELVKEVKDTPVVRRSTRARGSGGLVVPKDLDTVKPLVIVVPPDDVAIQKRKRPNPPSPEVEVGPKDASVGYIPLRKRARCIASEISPPPQLPVRLRLRILCDHTVDKVRRSLHALIRADLFVELELHVFVEKQGVKELNADSVVKVQEFPKKRQGARVVFMRLVFEAGKACEHLWVQRAKHLAEGWSPALCPRIIIIHDDPSLAYICKPGVVDVLKPDVDLAGHVGKLLEAATKELASR